MKPLTVGARAAAVAVWDDEIGAANVLNLGGEEGDDIVPSIVAFTGGDTVSVSGKEALALRDRFPRCAVSNVKRFLGRKPLEPSVQDLAELSAVQVAHRSGPEVQFAVTRLDGRTADYSVTDVAAVLFGHLLAQTHRFGKIEAKRAVVTVPAFYTSSQRAATRAAAEAAGLEVIRLLAEPTAACIAYGLDVGTDRTVIVADLGGGTFDVSVLLVREKATEVLATDGDSALGGEDVTTGLVRFVLARLDPAEREMIEGSLPLLRTLRTKCEAAKIALSDADEAEVELSSVRDPARKVPGFPADRRVRVTRRELEALAAPLMERMQACIRSALDASGLEEEEIEEVVLVGGATRMPCVRRAVEEATNGIPQCVSLNPEHAVAEGAAIAAALATGADPDRLRDLLMLDVLPRSVGLRDGAGSVVEMLAKNARLPASVSADFATAAAGQEGVTVDVVEGGAGAEGAAQDLGSFNFPVHNPRGAGAGERRVRVTFSASEDGMVRVTGEPLGEDGKVVPEADREASARAQVTTGLLLLYMLLLLVLYVVVKAMLFREAHLAKDYGIEAGSGAAPPAVDEL